MSTVNGLFQEALYIEEEPTAVKRRQSTSPSEEIASKVGKTITEPDPIENLKTKNKLIYFSTIPEVLLQHRKTLYQKKQPFFFVQIQHEFLLTLPFFIISRSEAPDEMKIPYPKKGGLCIPILAPEGVGHFLSVFVSFKEKKIFYYDSCGFPPNEKLRDFIKKVKRAVFQPDEKIQLISINTQHQDVSDEINCGRYTINFLKEMMDSSNLDETIAKLAKESISSDQIYEKGLTWANQLETDHAHQSC